MPAGSKTDAPLAKAEPISDGHSASGITQLRRGKKHQEQFQPETQVRRRKRHSSADTKVNAEGGAGGAPGAGAEIPLQPLEKTTVKQAVPLQPTEDDGEADIHLQLVEDPHRSRLMPKGGCDPMGSPCWSKLLAGPVAPWREDPTPEQVCWQNL
ncbi:hypothetical protein GRJ2_000350600 [Grus japonensis]|uniref:Uncharacterized protein n=1 Tax=Grus japonensis TaxID=30415 RepID=A0ABC9W1E0_GRUJA